MKTMLPPLCQAPRAKSSGETQAGREDEGSTKSNKSSKIGSVAYFYSRLSAFVCVCVECCVMDFLKKILFKRDLGLSVEEALPFWTIFILILSFDITLTVLFAVLIVRGH